MASLAVLAACGPINDVLGIPNDVHARLEEGSVATVYSDHEVTILTITDVLPLPSAPGARHWQVEVKVKNVGSTGILIGHWGLRTKDEPWIEPSSGQWLWDNFLDDDFNKEWRLAPGEEKQWTVSFQLQASATVRSLRYDPLPQVVPGDMQKVRPRLVFDAKQ